MIKFQREIPNKGLILIPCFEDKDVKFPQKIEKVAKEWIEEEKWEAKAKNSLNFTEGKMKVFLMGLGKEEKFEIAKFRDALAEFTRSHSELALDLANLDLDSDMMRQLMEAFLLSQYKFDKYKEVKEDKKEEKKAELVLIGENKFEAELKEATTLAEATILSRDLVNEPANIIYPETLAAAVEKCGKENGFEVEILGEDKIEELKMEAFLSVARAAEKRPRLIVMRYHGNQDDQEVLGLVGKGLTYDTGGLSLKPTSGMFDMKSDMGGSAAVIGAMSAIAKMKLKKNVIAVVAACENSIGGNAYRPGDVIGSMAGKTIEIGNTDAEGRLTLVDAVTYIIEKEKVSRVVDIATLTGAVLMALGHERSGIVSNNDEFYQKLEKASIFANEKIWRLPHDDEYLELLKSPVADLNNVGGRLAGTVTAGLFIREFVQDKPWLHIDIAGTSFNTVVKGDTIKGATGAGARLLYFLAKNM